MKEKRNKKRKLKPSEKGTKTRICPPCFTSSPSSLHFLSPPFFLSRSLSLPQPTPPLNVFVYLSTPKLFRIQVQADVLGAQVPDKVVAPVVDVARLGLPASGYAAPVPPGGGAAIVELLMRFLVSLQVFLRGEGLVAAGLVAEGVFDVVSLVLAGTC